RPGFTVYFGDICECTARCTDPAIDGRQRPCTGQCVYRKVLGFTKKGEDLLKSTQWWCRSLSKDKRSEEHTSELQSRENLVCRLLLEKKKIKNQLKQTLT